MSGNNHIHDSIIASFHDDLMNDRPTTFDTNVEVAQDTENNTQVVSDNIPLEPINEPIVEESTAFSRVYNIEDNLGTFVDDTPIIGDFSQNVNDNIVDYPDQGGDLGILHSTQLLHDHDFNHH